MPLKPEGVLQSKTAPGGGTGRRASFRRSSRILVRSNKFAMSTKPLLDFDRTFARYILCKCLGELAVVADKRGRNRDVFKIVFGYSQARHRVLGTTVFQTFQLVYKTGVVGGRAFDVFGTQAGRLEGLLFVGTQA